MEGKRLFTPGGIPFVDLGGEGEKLFFFHGNGFHPLSYSELLKPFLPRYHVIAMSARPLWKESLSFPKGFLDWNSLVPDVLQFLGEQKAQKVHAMGHSLGAVLLMLASTQRKNLFKSLSLLDPVLFSPALSFIWGILKETGFPWYHPFIAGAKKRKTHFPSRQAIWESYRKKEIFQKVSDSGLRFYIESTTEILSDGSARLIYSPRWEASIYAHGPHEVWRRVRHLPFPVLALRGEESDVFTGLSMKAFCHQFPHACKAVIPKAGHLVPLEAPKETARAVVDFLDEVGADSKPLVFA